LDGGKKENTRVLGGCLTTILSSLCAPLGVYKDWISDVIGPEQLYSRIGPFVFISSMRLKDIRNPIQNQNQNQNVIFGGR
jgi:hypothetical protein